MMTMKKLLILPVLLLPVFTGVEAGEPTPYAMPRTEVAPITDSETGRQYELYIKLPEGYADNADVGYPVIYTTDAVWHFEMLSGATEYLMPDVILVGVSWQKDLDAEQAFASRFRDYTMTAYADPERQAEHQAGQAGRHLNFIRNDVIRHVEDNYRADPDQRAYFGYSLGGQFGAYVLLAQPDTFRHYILGSPALGRGGAEFIDALEAETASRRQTHDANVFVSIGELEDRRMEAAEKLVSVLQRRRQSGLTLTGLEIIEDSNHGDAFPETVIRGVKWLSRVQGE